MKYSGYVERRREIVSHVGMAYDIVSVLRVSGLQVTAAAAGPAFVCGCSYKKKNCNICSWSVKLPALSHMIQKKI